VDLKKRQTILLAAAGLLVIVLVGDQLILRPQLEAWERRGRRIEQLRNDVDNGRDLLARQEQLQDRWEEIKRQCLPADLSAAEGAVLKSVDRWANEVRLSIAMIKPREKKDKEDRPQLEFSASARGSLESIARFLYILETAPLGLRLEEIELTEREKDRGGMAAEIRFNGLLMALEEAAETARNDEGKSREGRS
jgi:Tfp pilus assembly protein PilO